jgi:hypothetical protein
VYDASFLVPKVNDPLRNHLHLVVNEIIQVFLDFLSCPHAPQFSGVVLGNGLPIVVDVDGTDYTS